MKDANWNGVPLKSRKMAVTVHTGVLCSCGRNFVEEDQFPWDKSEWLCNACHKEVQQLRKDGKL